MIWRCALLRAGSPDQALVHALQNRCMTAQVHRPGHSAEVQRSSSTLHAVSVLQPVAEGLKQVTAELGTMTLT